MRQFFFATLLFFCTYGSQVNAGCTGICISSDPAGLVNADTLNLSGGSVNVYAHYNGACAMIGFDTLVWFRDGLPFDTTTSADAVFNGVWTYTTTISINSPGVYTVFPIQFITPTTQCGSILVQTRTSLYVVQHAQASLTLHQPSSQRIVVNNNTDLPISRVRVFDLTGRAIHAELIAGDDFRRELLLLENGPSICIITVEFTDGSRRSEKVHLIRQE